MQNILFCYRTSYSGLEIPNTVLELGTVLEKFLKNIKRAGQNRRAGGKFFSKSINVQTQIRPYRGNFFLKINKRACTSIWHTRVLTFLFKLNLTWHRALFVETYSRNYIFVGAYAIKPNLT